MSFFYFLEELYIYFTKSSSNQMSKKWRHSQTNYHAKKFNNTMGMPNSRYKSSLSKLEQNKKNYF